MRTSSASVVQTDLTGFAPQCSKWALFSHRQKYVMGNVTANPQSCSALLVWGVGCGLTLESHVLLSTKAVAQRHPADSVELSSRERTVLGATEPGPVPKGTKGVDGWQDGCLRSLWAVGVIWVPQINQGPPDWG